MKSYELRQLEICKRRGIKLDSLMEKRLYYLTKGFEGEEVAYQWFQTYSNGQLNIITDYWFSHGKNMQADLLVILNHRWIVVEVKNFSGYFEYRDNDCYLNGKLMSDNYFSQLTHRARRLQHIANDFDNNIKVESVMVFIGEHCDVEISSKISTKILLRNQLKAYIQALTNEQIHDRPTYSMDKIVRHLENYRVEAPFKPMVLDSDKVAKEIQRGISCSSCQSFNTDTTHKTVKCRTCGQIEFKKQAVVRAALELRQLYYYEPNKITNHNIYDYLAGLISRKTIMTTMNSHYQVVNKSKYSYYDVTL